MEDEASPGLDRSAVVDGAVGRLARIDLELPKKRSKGHPGALLADANPDRAILVMDAHRDDRPLEPRIGHPGHCQQQLAGKETGLFHHRPTMRRAQLAGKC
jgi:hypothetical protein